MKVVYHDKYKEVYASDPAAKAGRIECIYKDLIDRFEFVKPKEATEVDLRLVHTQSHIDSIKRHQLYDIALLAVGGAIRSAQLRARSFACSKTSLALEVPAYSSLYVPLFFPRLPHWVEHTAFLPQLLRSV